MSKGCELYKEGDFGNFYYIVKSGELELIYNTGEIKLLNKGDSFGDLALIQKNTRNSNVTAISDIEIYCLEGEKFKEIMLRMNHLELKERINYLTHHPIFKFFSNNVIHDIAENMLKCEFEKGENLEENQLKNSLFLIKEGSFSNLIINKKDLNNKKNKKNVMINDYFGLSNLIYSNKRHNCNIISQTYSKCYKITKCVFLNILGDDFLNKIFENITRGALLRIKMLKLFSIDEYLQKILPIFKLKIYNKNDVVFGLNDNEEHKLLVLLEGDLIDVSFFFSLIFLIFY